VFFAFTITLIMVRSLYSSFLCALHTGTQKKKKIWRRLTHVFFGSLRPQHHYFLVDKIVSTAVELLSQFFVLAASKELCSAAASFEEGLTPASEIIDDAPKVFQLLAMTVKGASLNQERLAFGKFYVCGG
jgi:hypothetical protein